MMTLNRFPRTVARTFSVLSLSFLMVSTALPAQAAETTTEELGSVTNGAETSQIEELIPEPAALKAPQMSAKPPVNGDGNPGATMGQSIKELSQTSNLSDASLQKALQDVKAAKAGKDVSVSPTEFSSALSDAVVEADNKVSSATAAYTSPTGSGVLGMDVSGWQPIVNWNEEYANGARFAYVKATEGNSYTNDSFSNQYVGATASGMTRGAYHFAIPTLESTGAEQARYFVANGGGWSADGRTLPGLLDIEYNPYWDLGDSCYDLTPAQMRQWIQSFVDEYRRLTGRVPALYTTAHWWNECTGNTTLFNYLPLHLANYASTPGVMPSGWKNYDLWQYSADGPFPGDSNVFNGSLSDLRNFATVAGYKPKGSTSVTVSGFVDVPKSHYFYNEIMWLANTGISRGWDDGTYRPYNNITRGEMAAFLYRLAGSPAYTPPTRAKFSDVPTDHVFYKEISWMNVQGIANGWADGTYRPGTNISREQMAAFLYRLAGEPAYTPPAKPGFWDYGTNRTFYKEVSWMKSRGIANGYDDGTYGPFDFVSREHMAAFIYRYARMA